MLAVFKPFFPVFNYIANYTYYKTVLCENKDIPEMACNGKCQLMKEMAETQQKEESEPIIPRLDLSEIPITILQKTYCFETYLFKTEIANNYTNVKIAINSICSDVLCPPPDSVL